jgi:hypothetical protein
MHRARSGASAPRPRTLRCCVPSHAHHDASMSCRCERAMRATYMKDAAPQGKHPRQHIAEKRADCSACSGKEPYLRYRIKISGHRRPQVVTKDSSHAEPPATSGQSRQDAFDPATFKPLLPNQRIKRMRRSERPRFLDARRYPRQSRHPRRWVRGQFRRAGANSRSTRPLSTVASGEAIYASLLLCYQA